MPDPVVGPRHQPGVGANGRYGGGDRRLRRRWQRRPGRPQGQGPLGRGSVVVPDDHLPVDPRRVRRGDSRNLRSGPPARWPGVHGWRQPQCPGGLGAPGGYWRRCFSHESAQNLLYPPRRWRPGHGPDWHSRSPQTVRRQPPGGAGTRPGPEQQRGQRRALGKCEHPADQLDVHSHDGPAAGRCQRGGDPLGQLPGQPAGWRLPGALPRAQPAGSA
ncbi:hypothetical protein D3C71_1526640 [compost metagenome]